MRRVAAVATAILVSVLGLGIAFGSPAQAGGYVASDETHVLNMVNATRAGKGLGTLRSNEALVGMARRQADRMAAKGNIFHNLQLGDELTATGMNWRKAGENVGMGPDADMVEDAFLKSPHHYANIVDTTYNSAGIGVVDGADGRRYIVQVFANIASLAKPAAPAPVVHAAAAEPAPSSPAVAPAAAQPLPTATALAAAQTPTPKVQAPKARSADPNVVIGGVVEPLDLGTGV